MGRTTQDKRLTRQSPEAMHERRLDSRAHLHHGICRYCWGTGEVARGDARVQCPECDGLGALR